MKLPYIMLNKQVPWHGEFERDVHQERKKVGKPFFPRPKNSNDDHGEVARNKNYQKDLSQKNKRREGIDAEIILTVLKSILLPSHGI